MSDRAPPFYKKVHRRFTPDSVKNWIQKRRHVRDCILPAFDATESIFIHIPKTGGSSVGRALYGTDRTGHFPAAYYRKSDPQKYQKYYKFCIVRNPWDRLVSAYHYLSQGGKNQSDIDFASSHLSKYTSFDQFVKQFLSEDAIWSHVHLWPQVHFLRGAEGQFSLDYIGRHESMAESFGIISENVKAPVRELGLENASKRGRYQDYYDQAARGIVAKLYQADVSRLDYEF